MTKAPIEEQVQEIFKESSKYIDDILNGRTTIAKATKVPETNLEDCFVQAQNALMVEDYAKAEELFALLLVLNNKDTRAMLGLAGALEGQGKYDFAAPIYFMVLITTLNDPVAPFRAGICLMQLGKKEEASKLFELAADCEDSMKDPKKLVYVQKAKGMLKALSE